MNDTSGTESRVLVEPEPVSPKVHRLEQLDSLRGLAALIVAFGHSWTLFVPATSAGQRRVHLVLTLPTRFLLDGHSAVLFFFLLSGFVLYLPSAKADPPRYRDYITRRICRIYLPYLPAILYAGTLVWLTYRPVPMVSNFFSWRHEGFHEAVRRFFAYATLILPFNHSDWNSSLWSVSEEMRVSLFFPLLAMAVRRLSGKGALTLGLLAPFVAGLCIHAAHHFYPFMTLHYAGVFVLGSLVAKHRESLGRRLQRFGVWPVCVGLVLITYGTYVSYIVPHVFAEAVVDLIITFGNITLLLAAINIRGFRDWLLLRPIHRLGVVSYSFYLYHLPSLFVCICFLWARFGPLVTYAAAFVLTTAVAVVSYQWVELPAIRLGRYLTHTRMQQTGQHQHP